MKQRISHTRPTLHWMVALVVATLGLTPIGCDGDGRAPDDDTSTPDVTSDLSDTSTDTVTPPEDTIAPTVVALAPMPGATDVPTTVMLTVELSEPMDPDRGRITLSTGDDFTSDDATWMQGDTLVQFALAALPQATTVEVTLADFTDIAGNPLEPIEPWTFTTLDARPPTITTTSPAEGDTGLSARLSTVHIEFDRPMDTTVGTARFEAGAATVDAMTWSAADMAVVLEVSNLDHETDYRLVLDGFVGDNGVPLDGEPVLGDGALDFSTGPDTDGPRAIDSEPLEGTSDLDPATLDELIVRFDESLVPAATLELCNTLEATCQTVDVEWPLSDDRLLRVDLTALASPLQLGQAYALDLTPLTDVAGNTLDGAPYLGDGKLDFNMGPDTVAPRLLSTTPTDGAFGLDPTSVDTIEWVFDEAMDPTHARVSWSGDFGQGHLTGTWSDGNTRLTLDVTGRLIAGEDYTLDPALLRDAAGNLVDPSGAVLGANEVLDLGTVAATGESCQSPLNATHATVDGTDLVWTFAEGALTQVDGGTADCQVSYTDPLPDGAIVYYKSSPATADGGAALHITARSTDGVRDINLEVRYEACHDSTDSQQRRCLERGPEHETWIDGPPGMYFIMVSGLAVDDLVAPSPEIEVRLETVDTVPIGESCSNPYVVGSVDYQPPASTGGVHRWTFAGGEHTGWDMGIGWDTPGGMSCTYSRWNRDAPTQDNDAVVRFDKASDTSLLVVEVSASDGQRTSFEVLDACDPTQSATRSLVCRAETPGEVEILAGPAGEYFIWVETEAFSSTAFTVDVRELEAAPGEACANGHPVSPNGQVSLVGSSTLSIKPPDCLGTGPVEWYRTTLTENALSAVLDAAVPFAFVDPYTNETLACYTDGSVRPLGAVGQAGEDLCIAVPVGAGATSMTLAEVVYPGVGRRDSDPGLGRPLDENGAPVPILLARWLVEVGDQVAIGLLQSVASRVTDASGPWQIHDDTVGIGFQERGLYTLNVQNSLFVASSIASNTSGGVLRLYTAANNLWSPVIWDSNTPYGDGAIGVGGFGYDGSQFIVAGDGADSGLFYELSATMSSATGSLIADEPLFTDVRGVAADPTYLYVVGTHSGVDGVFRIDRIAAAAPGDVAVTWLTEGVDLALDASGSAADQQPAVLDSPPMPNVLYFRFASPPGVHAIANPASANPVYLGRLTQIATEDDSGFALGPAGDHIYYLETFSGFEGSIRRLD